MGNEPHVPRASARDQSTTEPLSGNHEERFLKAFDEYSDALFRHASIRLSDRERAVELTHDTFLKAWGYTRAGHEIESYRPFLYKILNNLIIDEYRKRKEDSLDALLEREGVDEGSFEELHSGSLEIVVDTMDARRAVEAIAVLPDTYREVLTLRFVDGLTPKEISLLIEETENVVSVRLHRGIKALKSHIESKSRRNEDTTQ
jgi:RNA polymerase sigma-70 factor, ECF subfamily